MKQSYQRFELRYFPWAVFGILALAVCLSWLFLPRSTVHAANDRLITIYHDGQAQVVSSDAATVSEVLNRAGVTVGQHDLVEPDPATKLAVSNFNINVYRAEPVTVVDGPNRYHIMTPLTGNKQIAEAAGLTVYDEDILTVSRIDDFVGQGTIGLLLTIKRSTPLKVVLYDKSLDMRTQATTVAGFLKEKNIMLNAGDKLFPDANTPVTAGMAVAVYRDGSQLVRQVAIPFVTRRIYDANQLLGYHQVQTAGAPGQRLVISGAQITNGRTTQVELQSVVLSQPVDQIEVIGTKVNTAVGDKSIAMSLAGISPNNYQYADYIITHESGWCATKWQGQWGGCPAYHGTPTSSYFGYGLCQATPGYKMQTAGADWATNPITQLKWCTNYANAKYGGWYNAYLHWVVYHSW